MFSKFFSKDENGEFEILVGPHSRELPLKAVIDIQLEDETQQSNGVTNEYKV